MPDQINKFIIYVQNGEAEHLECRVHVFPFRLTDNNFKEYEENRWYEFWQGLKEEHDFFEEKKAPSNVEVRDLTCIFNASG